MTVMSVTRATPVDCPLPRAPLRRGYASVAERVTLPQSSTASVSSATVRGSLVSRS